MTEIASTGQLRASLVRWLIVLVPGILLLGFLSSSWAGSGPDNPWFAALAKPGLYPKPMVFPLVWTALYVLMGVALAIVVTARAAPGRGLAIGLFLVQLALNLAWSPVFFGAHQISIALVLIGLLDVVLLATLVIFAKVRPVAALLLAPYLAWVLFATLLTWQILDLNRAADGGMAPGAAVRMQI